MRGLSRNDFICHLEVQINWYIFVDLIPNDNIIILNDRFPDSVLQYGAEHVRDPLNEYHTDEH